MNEKLKSNLTVPNALSLIRLLMIPAIVVTYVNGSYLTSLILIIISGLTDTLDGFIARHFNQISSLGKILDPLADKLTVTAVVICLTLRHNQMLLLMCVLIAKEALMFAGAYVLFKNGKRPSESKIWGKAATFLLYIVMAVIIVSDVISSMGHGFPAPPALLWVLSVAACLCMILALLQYLPIFTGILNGSYSTEKEQFVQTTQTAENVKNAEGNSDEAENQGEHK